MTYKFKPDFIVSPAEIIQDYLDANNISVIEFAHKLDLPVHKATYILQGKIRIDEMVAGYLTVALGYSVKFWTNLEAQYQRALNEQADLQRMIKQSEE